MTVPAAGTDPEPGKVPLMPMHQAKGLEFKGWWSRPAMTTFCRFSPESSQSLTIRIWNTYTIPNVSSCMSPVPGRGIICW